MESQQWLNFMLVGKRFATMDLFYVPPRYNLEMCNLFLDIGMLLLEKEDEIVGIFLMHWVYQPNN